MKTKSNILLLTILAIFSLALLLVIGCQPKPEITGDEAPAVENGDGPAESGQGEPDGDGPASPADDQGKPDEEPDTGELPDMGDDFQPADEFKFLVDLERLNDQIADDLEKIESAIDGEDVEGEGLRDGRNFLEELGLVQQSIMAEANPDIVHAHAVYSLSPYSMGEMGSTLDAGTAEVGLPARFPAHRLAGYLFIANPGRIVEGILDSLNRMMSSESTGMGMRFNMDMLAQLYGIESTRIVYEWMSDELVLFSIKNPAFNPGIEIGPENEPFFLALAISSDTPDRALDLIYNLTQVIAQNPPVSGIQDIQAVEEEINGYEALTVQLTLVQDTMDNENQVNQVSNNFGFTAVNIPGYVIISNRDSIDSVLALYNAESPGTGRNATIEAEWDADFMIENFNPARTGSYVSLIDTAELRALVSNIYRVRRDFRELGRARVSVTAVDNETIELDILADREGVMFIQALQEIIDETPDETWRAIGRRFGELSPPQSEIPLEMPTDTE